MDLRIPKIANAVNVSFPFTSLLVLEVWLAKSILTLNITNQMDRVCNPQDANS